MESYISKSPKMLEQEAFEMLLCAIYSRRYDVNPMSLLALTRLADYYNALPVVSRSLDSAFLRNSEFISDLFVDYYEEILPAAIKLRHRELYKDCLVLSIGPWGCAPLTESAFPELQKLVRDAYNQISTKVAQAYMTILKYATGPENGFVEGEQEYVLDLIIRPTNAADILREQEQKGLFDWSTVYREDENYGSFMSLPELYRKVYDAELKKDHELYPGSDVLCKALSPIIGGTMLLDRRQEAGIGHCKDYFNCLEIEDNNLLWDVTEMDW
jgi:hypothetical protein